MVIIKSSNARAVAALIDERPASNPLVAATSRDDRRPRATRRRSRAAEVRADVRRSRRSRSRSAAGRSRRPRGSLHATVRHAIGMASRNIRTVAEKQRPRTWTVSPAAWSHDSTACAAARSRRLLRPRRTLSPAVVPADDRHSGTRRRRAGRDCRVPEAGPDRHVCGARGRGLASVSTGRCARDRRARVRHGDACHAWTGSSARETPTSPRPSRSSRATARSISLPDRARSPSSRRPASRRGSPRTSSRRPSTIPTRARS